MQTMNNIKNTIKKWFSRALTRHIVAGFVIIGLQNVLINNNVDPQTAKDISALAGQLIKGEAGTQ